MGDTAAVGAGQPHRLRMLWVTGVWGTCFVVIRWALPDAPVLWFAALRAVVAGAALLAWGGWQHRPSPRGGHAWLLVGALGLVNVTLAFAAMFAGVAGLAAGTAAVLANAQPLLILLPAWWLYGERVSARAAVPLAGGFAGLVLVALPGGGGRGAWLSLLAAAGITGGTLLSRRLGGLDLVMVSAWHFVIGGAALALLAAAVEGAPAIEWTPRFVVALGFLAVVGTAAAFVAWFTETQRAPLGAVAAWTFLVPVFGLGLGVVLLGERPTGWTLLGVAIVLGSLWASLSSTARPEAATPQATSCSARSSTETPYGSSSAEPVREDFGTLRSWREGAVPGGRRRRKATRGTGSPHPGSSASGGTAGWPATSPHRRGR